MKVTTRNTSAKPQISSKPVASAFGSARNGLSSRVSPAIARGSRNGADISEEAKISHIYNLAKIPITYVQCEIVRIEPLFMDSAFVRKNFVSITSAIEPTSDGSQSLLGTLSDQRMGAGPHAKSCTTCSEPDCAGHLGHIDFGDPDKVTDLQYLIPPLINPELGVPLRQIINVTCPSCSRVMIPDQMFVRGPMSRLKTAPRLKMMEEFSRTQRKSSAYICRDINPSFDISDEKLRPRFSGCNIEHEAVIYIKETNRIHRQLNPVDNLEIYRILRGLSSRDVAKLGFVDSSAPQKAGLIRRHPVNIMQQTIQVLPPNLRQSTAKDSEEGSRQHFDQSYRFFIKSIAQARALPLGEDRNKIIDAIGSRHLNIHSSQHGKSGSHQDSKNSQNKVKGIKQLMSGKEGHIRRDQMGRRQDYSSRGVVTGDKNLILGEIGIPDDVWKRSYDRIYVMEHNIQYFEYLHKQGALVYYFPYEDYYRRGQILVSELEKKLVLENKTLQFRVRDAFGIVMREGRVVLFGRNPSIHKVNILSGVVKREYGNTFRMHNATTVAQNMDYDGDEGNYTFPQEPMAEAEARILLSIPRNIVNTENSSTVISGVIDTNTTAYIMTAIADVGMNFVDEEELDKMRGLLTDTDALVTLDKRLSYYNIDRLSTKGVFSMLFPSDFNYRGEGHDQTVVEIRDGILLSGTLAKGQIGIAKGSITQKLYGRRDGRRRASVFINDCMKVLDWYISQIRGLSIGPDDIQINSSEISQLVAANQRKIDKTVASISSPTNDKASQKRREAETINALQSAGDAFGQKITREKLPPSSSMRQMIRARAKGDIFHAAQVVAQGGQQYELGQRLPKTLTGNRGSVFDPFGDTSIVGAGFNKNPLRLGFQPREQISHHIASRVTLIDTATKTVDAGEYHNLVNKALMDLVVAYDGTLRDVNGIIVQMMAGVDCLDPFCTTNVKLDGMSFGFFVDIETLVSDVNSRLTSW